MHHGGPGQGRAPPSSSNHHGAPAPLLSLALPLCECSAVPISSLAPPLLRVCSSLAPPLFAPLSLSLLLPCSFCMPLLLSCSFLAPPLQAIALHLQAQSAPRLIAEGWPIIGRTPSGCLQSGYRLCRSCCRISPSRTSKEQPCVRRHNCPARRREQQPLKSSLSVWVLRAVAVYGCACAGKLWRRTHGRKATPPGSAWLGCSHANHPERSTL